MENNNVKSTEKVQGFIDKINDKSLTYAVVGLGYVGLPLAVTAANKGYHVFGLDVSAKKVELLKRAENYIADINDDVLRNVIDSGKLEVSTDFSFVGKADAILICVPTPLDLHQQPDLKYIESASAAVGKNLSKGSVVILESTTYPGTTSEFVKPLLEKESGLKCREDFYLGFSPERVDPGNKSYKTHNTPKIVGGIGKDTGEIMVAVYEAILDGDVNSVSSPEVAEMEKILENTYRSVNIALVNEFTMLANEMGINIWEVIDAAKTKPYGFQAFYPGPGVGGHCIPLDPSYLSWKAREYAFHTTLIETSGTINDRMPEYVADRTDKMLNAHGKCLRNSKILALGVAYKRDKDKTYTSIPSITADVISKYDAIIILTDHSNIDYNFVIENAQLVFDTRNATKNAVTSSKVELL